MSKRKPVKREQKGFRFTPQAIEALRLLARVARRTETETLEWLIEAEFRARKLRGEMPIDQDPFDLIRPSDDQGKNDGLTH